MAGATVVELVGVPDDAGARAGAGEVGGGEVGAVDAVVDDPAPAVTGATTAAAGAEP